MSHSIQEKMGNYNADDKKEHRLMRKGLAVALAGAVALGAAGCSGDKVGAQAPEINPSTTTEAPANSEKLPKEVASFVEQYGYRYSDPVSTYYAYEAYKAANPNQSLIIEDDFVANYDKSAQQEKSSNLGFERYTLSKGAEFNSETSETSMKVFNEYLVKQLSLYMNYSAMNPYPEAQDIIDFEFESYCSQAGGRNLVEMTRDDNNILSLMETAKSIVSKYGDAAIYNVAPGSHQQGDPNTSLFDERAGTSIIRLDANGLVDSTQNTINFVVNIATYEGQTVLQQQETIKNFEFSIMRQIHPDPNVDFTYISIGQAKIR